MAAISAVHAQPAAGRKPVGTPIRYERYALGCRLLAGAATSAPAGVDPRYIQQILVSNAQTRTTLVGTEVDYSVRRRIGGREAGVRNDPPGLYPGQWTTVGETIGGVDCQASVLVAVPLIEGRPDRP